MSAVTTGMFVPGAVDEVAFARFVAKTEAGYRRAVAKAASNPRSLYHGWTEAEWREACRDALVDRIKAYRSGSAAT